MILGRNLNHLAWSRFFMRIRSWNTFRESNTLGFSCTYLHTIGTLLVATLGRSTEGYTERM